MATLEPLGPGRIEPRELEQEMRSSFLDYAMSVIVARALPAVRDGLKPVLPRVLYAMHEAGLQPNRPRLKCARVVGDVMGSYHPHGDQSIYDTLVRLPPAVALRAPPRPMMVARFGRPLPPPPPPPEAPAAARPVQPAPPQDPKDLLRRQAAR